MRPVTLVGLLATSVVVAQEPALVRGFAKRDCACQRQQFEENPRPVTVKAGKAIGQECAGEGDKVRCQEEMGLALICPSACVEYRTQLPLKREELEKAVAAVVSRSAAAAYKKKVPAKVLAQLQSKHPKWLPLLDNRSEHPEFIADFKLIDSFYLETPDQLSIVYFFDDLDHLLSGDMTWSFWKNGELLHESAVPYKSRDGVYVHQPCLAPATEKMDRIVLYGIAAGGDASGCCGPYALEDVATKGPVDIEANQDQYDRDAVYGNCAHSTDPKTGKYLLRPKK